MNYNDIPSETAVRILRDLKIDRSIPIRKKSPVHVSFQMSGMYQYPITTTSTQDILKFIFSEILHDIDKRSSASIKGMIAEAGEWMAQVEPSLAMQTKIRKIMSNLMLLKSRNRLILAVGDFAASLGGNSGK